MGTFLLLAQMVAKGDAVGLLIVPLFLIFFIGIIALSIYSHKKAKERWMQFARTYGLTYNPPGMGSQSHMSGWFDGIYVHIGTITRGSGKNRHTYTQFQAMLASGIMPYGLQVYQETMFSKVGVFFGGQDVQVGDAQLDATFIFKCNSPAAVTALVTLPEIRAALLEIVARQPSFVLEANRVFIERTGFISDLNTMYTTLTACVRLAQVLHSVCGVGQPQPPLAKGPAPQPKAAVVPAPMPAPVAVPVAVPAPKAAQAAPTPQSAPRPDNTPRGNGGILALLDKLGDPALPSLERDGILESLRAKPASVSIVADRVDYTSSFDVPDALKDGRTVIGTVNGLRTKVAVRFPKSRDKDVAGMRRGTTFTVQAMISGFDALFDRVNLDAA
jgi:hypothetical protein